VHNFSTYQQVINKKRKYVSYQQVINKLSTGFTKLSTSYQQVFCKVMHKLSTGFAKLCTSYQQNWGATPSQNTEL
jgi:hypothetical protein